MDRYPIPKIEDLFAKLSKGKYFSKLDLSQAYQQLLLDDDSKKYVAINTHRRLFQYTRLPFGISSAPGIFQRVMESVLQGLIVLLHSKHPLELRDGRYFFRTKNTLLFLGTHQLMPMQTL